MAATTTVRFHMDRAFPFTPPDYLGGSLVNLVAEFEWRLTGAAPSPRLHAELGSQIPQANTYIFLLLDGLGTHQLDHPAAASLAASMRGTIDAPFPTTTTVSLASIATGLPPRRHGLLGHVIWLPELAQTVNSLKWIGPGGQPVDVDTDGFLPTPNLWERLAGAGVEAITVQPGQFDRTPLSRAVYRGCRFEAIWDMDEFVRAVVDLSSRDRRLIFAYLPPGRLCGSPLRSTESRIHRFARDRATLLGRDRPTTARRCSHGGHRGSRASRLSTRGQGPHRERTIPRPHPIRRSTIALRQGQPGSHRDIRCHAPSPLGGHRTSSTMVGVGLTCRRSVRRPGARRGVYRRRRTCRCAGSYGQTTRRVSRWARSS